jgi:hypothetical protein
MVFIVNRGKLITGKKLSHQSEMSQLSVELDRPEENMEPELGLPTDSMEENTSNDLSSFNMNELQGEGFRAAGAGFRVAGAGINKMKYIPKQDKIRKFVSLKL